MILDNEFDSDPRVKNEVQSLQKAGHEVFVLCYNFSDKVDKDWHGARIVRINANKTYIKKLNGLNNTLFNFFPIYWKKRIELFVKDYQIENLHVHDLWMLDAALRANRKLKLPLIVDLHENFVFAIQHYKYSTTFPGNVLISHEKWKSCEPKWLSQTDNIIVVIEEAKDRLIKLGIPGSKISVVPNYVNIADYSNESRGLTHKLKQEYADHFVMTYTGGFDVHRGLDIPIKAIPTILNTIPNFKFVLVGGGSNEPELKQLAKDYGVEPYVDFRGYLPHGDLPSYVSASDICIIPHRKTPHTDNTIPHKLFQYMVMEKPVLGSNCTPIERIITETRSGEVYQHDSPDECAQAVITSYQSERQEVGAQGKAAVESKYNWQEASKKLISLYDR